MKIKLPKTSDKVASQVYLILVQYLKLVQCKQQRTRAATSSRSHVYKLKFKMIRYDFVYHQKTDHVWNYGNFYIHYLHSWLWSDQQLYCSCSNMLCCTNMKNNSSLWLKMKLETCSFAKHLMESTVKQNLIMYCCMCFTWAFTPWAFRFV